MMTTVFLSILCLVLIIMFGTTVVPIIMKLVMIIIKVLYFLLKIGVVIFFVYLIIRLLSSL